MGDHKDKDIKPNPSNGLLTNDFAPRRVLVYALYLRSSSCFDLVQKDRKGR